MGDGDLGYIGDNLAAPRYRRRLHPRRLYLDVLEAGELGFEVGRDIGGDLLGAGRNLLEAGAHQVTPGAHQVTLYVRLGYDSLVERLARRDPIRGLDDAMLHQEGAEPLPHVHAGNFLYPCIGKRKGGTDDLVYAASDLEDVCGDGGQL